MIHSQSLRPTILACVLVTIAGGALAGNSGLTKSQMRRVHDEFLPAFRRGDLRVSLESLSSVVGSLTDDQLPQLNAVLARSGVPPAANVLLHSRVQLMREGAHRDVPKPGLREYRLLRQQIDTETRAILSHVDNVLSRVEQASESASLRQYELLLWELNALQPELRTCMVLAQYGAEANRAKKRHAKADMSLEQQPLLDQGDKERVRRSREAVQRTAEIHCLVRLRRMARAVQTLKGGANLEDRLVAAWSLDIDGDVLQLCFPSGADISARRDSLTKSRSGTRFQLAVLNDPELPGRIEQMVENGRKSAGADLLVKARALFTGLHWWVRGRYGMGSDCYGLLKSRNWDQSYETQVALRLPTVLPKPTDPREMPEFPTPVYERRHHYLASQERNLRQLLPESGRRSAARSRNAEGRTTDPHSLPAGSTPRDTFYSSVPTTFRRALWLQGQSTYVELSGLPPRPQFTREELWDGRPVPPFRIVGYLEYGLALANLDRFTATANRSELEAANRIVAARPELTIYGSLPLCFRRSADGIVRAEAAPGAVASRPRRSLAWVIALARTEFGGMLACCTDHTSPFYQVTPRAYDYCETLQLLLEGVDHHATVLRQQARPPKGRRSRNSSSRQTIALLRRARIGRQMLEPLLRAGKQVYGSDQVASMKGGNNTSRAAVLVQALRHYADEYDRIEKQLAADARRYHTVSSAIFGQWDASRQVVFQSSNAFAMASGSASGQGAAFASGSASGSANTSSSTGGSANTSGH